MPTTLTNGIQLPDKGSVDWYSSMQSNYNLIDTHLGDTDVHVTAEDKANWNSKQGSLSQAQLDAIAQVATNTDDIATLQSDKADASHTHSSSDITDIGDYATKQYVDNSISGLVDNAPAALDTLKELSTALNDDANFASTVTTALSAKANSADLATVAISGSYNDLSNKPTINDSTITIQKNGSLVGTFTVNGSAKTIDIPVPTKTSDLTNDSDFVVSSNLATVATSGFYNDLDNKPYIPDKISDLIDDSNFVDTSNPAVSSGITSAKVTNYDTHIADTDIHVTASDKTTWNAVSSKANDSDVVHKSGNETITGTKTFENVNIQLKSTSAEYSVSGGFKSVSFYDKNLLELSRTRLGIYSSGISYIKQTILGYDSNNQQVDTTITFSLSSLTKPFLRPDSDNLVTLGTSGNKWKEVYATNYYYGSNNVEFSTKFVTTDTNQIISGAKTFSDTLTIYNSDSSQNTKNLTISSSKIQVGDTSNNDAFGIRLNAGASYVAQILAVKDTSGTQNLQLDVRTKDSSNNLISSMARLRLYTNGYSTFEPNVNTSISLGSPSNKWYKINGVEPSSLSMPDLSNGIDISSYITNFGAGTVNEYTPVADGWISIANSADSPVFIRVYNDYGFEQIVYSERNEVGGTTSGTYTRYGSIMIPCIKNIKIYIIVSPSSSVLVSAKFYPCQGNV